MRAKARPRRERCREFSRQPPRGDQEMQMQIRENYHKNSLVIVVCRLITRAHTSGQGASLSLSRRAFHHHLSARLDGRSKLRAYAIGANRIPRLITSVNAHFFHVPFRERRRRAKKKEHHTRSTLDRAHFSRNTAITLGSLHPMPHRAARSSRERKKNKEGSKSREEKKRAVRRNSRRIASRGSGLLP